MIVTHIGADIEIKKVRGRGLKSMHQELTYNGAGNTAAVTLLNWLL